MSKAEIKGYDEWLDRESQPEPDEYDYDKLVALYEFMENFLTNTMVFGEVNINTHQDWFMKLHYLINEIEDYAAFKGGL